MEERRGESIDVLWEKAGKEHQFLIEEEVRKIGQDHFLSLGISADLTDSAKITRYAELKSGKEQTPEEYKVALNYHGNKADIFHALLKHRLGQ